MTGPRLVIVSPPRRQKPRLRVPMLEISIAYEADLKVYIRGARDEQDAAPLRAWLELDPEMRELCRLARSIRDRRAA